MPEPHDDLIADLRSLGDHLDVPPPRDQRALVRERLSQARPARRWRLWLIGVLVAVAGATGAIAPARAAVVTAVGNLLHVAGVDVRVEKAPTPTGSPSPLPSRRSAALEEARRVAPFPVKVPAKLGTPEQVTLADQSAAGVPRVIEFGYRGGTVLFDQFDGTVSPVWMKQAPDAEWVYFGADVALWLAAPHSLTYVDRDGVERTATTRLAGPTLVWQSGAVTYRLEGLPTKEEAVEVARSVA